MKNLSIKLVLPLLLIGAVYSCSSDEEEKDGQFCKCMQAGEELNKFSSGLFDRELTQKDADKMKQLKAKKEKECKDYQTMSGDEMLKRKKMCK